MDAENNKKKVPSKRKTTKKVKPASTKLSAVKIDPTESALYIEDVIKQAFLRFYDTASVKQAKVKDLEHLDHIAEEYLKAYMILGYDINGEKVSILHAENSHDKDALVEHLRTTLLGIVGNNN
jgi:hypothetical protein